MRSQAQQRDVLELDLAAVEVSEEEILDDLLYPARRDVHLTPELAAARLNHAALARFPARELDRADRDRLAA
jgi:hypothetical protein